MKFDGGKAVVQRILQAYGFTMQKQLHDHLGVGNGTVSTWIKRNYFPGEVVIRCALETGADLNWLATGIQSNEIIKTQATNNINECITIKRVKLKGGVLIDDGIFKIDNSLLENNTADLIYVSSGNDSWIIDTASNKLSNGKLLLSIDKVVDIYNVARLPNNRLQVKGRMSEFECGIDEVEAVGQVILTLEKN